MLYKRLKQHTKWQYRDLASQFGLYKPNYDVKGVRILCYHGITKDGRNDINSRFISADYFEQQIAFFKQNFNLVSVADAFENKFDNERLNIALTFDDGYANNLKYALPILEKYQAPASFYVTGAQNEALDILWPDFIDLVTFTCGSSATVLGDKYTKNNKGELEFRGKTLKQVCRKASNEFKIRMISEEHNRALFEHLSELTDYWKQLSTGGLKELSQPSLVTIGSHGYYHNELNLLDAENAKEELIRSKNYLEKTCGYPITELAFPNGAYSELIKDVAEEVGFKQQLALDYLLTEDEKDPHILNRFGINPFISWTNQLHCLVKNSYW